MVLTRLCIYAVKLPVLGLSLALSLYVYSQPSLSRPHLSRITAYIEVKFWSLFLLGNLRTGNKILWKRGEINFSSFPHYIIYISNFRSQITYSFVKCGCLIYCFPHSLNSDMSRYGYLEVFPESLGIRDNES